VSRKLAHRAVMRGARPLRQSQWQDSPRSRGESWLSKPMASALPPREAVCKVSISRCVASSPNPRTTYAKQFAIFPKPQCPIGSWHNAASPWASAQDFRHPVRNVAAAQRFFDEFRQALSAPMCAAADSVLIPASAPLRCRARIMLAASPGSSASKPLPDLAAQMPR